MPGLRSSGETVEKEKNSKRFRHCNGEDLLNREVLKIYLRTLVVSGLKRRGFKTDGREWWRRGRSR